MSATLPPVVDAWRMVTARRCFEGELKLAKFSRLRSSLVDTEGECRFGLEFGRDELHQAFSIDAARKKVRNVSLPVVGKVSITQGMD